jgi:hypothetical protein
VPDPTSYFEISESIQNLVLTWVLQDRWGGKHTTTCKMYTLRMSKILPQKNFSNQNCKTCENIKERISQMQEVGLCGFRFEKNSSGARHWWLRPVILAT